MTQQCERCRRDAPDQTSIEFLEVLGNGAKGPLLRWLTVGATTRRVVTAGLLVVCAVIWVLVNGPIEGPTLLVLSPDHGVTLSDLASVAAVVVAAALLVGCLRRRPPH